MRQRGNGATRQLGNEATGQRGNWAVRQGGNRAMRQQGSWAIRQRQHSTGNAEHAIPAGGFSHRTLADHQLTSITKALNLKYNQFKIIYFIYYLFRG